MQASKNIQPFELYFLRFRFLVTRVHQVYFPIHDKTLDKALQVMLVSKINRL